MRRWVGGSKVTGKKDVTRAMIFPEREILRLLARARPFLRRRCAFCPWRTQRVSASVLSCPPQLLPSSVQHPAPFSPRLPLRCVPSRYTLSFSLVYPPSLFSPTLREIRRRGETLPGRWSPVGFFSLGSSIDPPTQFCFVRFRLGNYFEKFLMNFDRSITPLSRIPFKSLKLFRPLL